MTTALAELLKDSTYKLTQFKPAHIKTLARSPNLLSRTGDDFETDDTIFQEDGTNEKIFDAGLLLSTYCRL